MFENTDTSSKSGVQKIPLWESFIATQEIKWLGGK